MLTKLRGLALFRTPQDRTVTEVRRLGKQIAIGLDGGLWLVLHLKIAGRLHWKTGAVKPGARNLLAVFEFENGSLTLTEAGTIRRAALHVAEGEAASMRSARAESRRSKRRSTRSLPRCAPPTIR